MLQILTVTLYQIEAKKIEKNEKKNTHTHKQIVPVKEHLKGRRENLGVSQ